MIQTASILKQKAVFHDPELTNSIIKLEDAYVIKDEIDIFNQLVNFSKNVNTPYHGWFRYREGYSHVLIKHLIEQYSLPKNEVIVDPFCGSGTTIVEAAFQGYSSFGLDVNPLSAFVSSTKATAYDDNDILEAESVLASFDYSRISVEVVDFDDAPQFFDIDKLQQLLSVKAFINQIGSPKIRNLFQLGLLSIIEDVSNRKRDGNGLLTRLSRVQEVFPYFKDKMLSILKDIREVRISTNIASKAIAGDATNLYSTYHQHFDRNVGAIIFSPPYANSFDYFESYKMELLFGDFVNSISDIQHIRKYAVRSFVNTSGKPVADYPIVNQIAQEIELSIPDKERLTGKKDTRTRKVPNMIKGYFNDMSKIIEQCSMLLKPGRKCFIVVDQSAYLGVLVPSDLILGMLAEEYGLRVKEIIICRKARTSPQQLKRFPYLNDLLRESIVVLEKQ